MRPNPVTPTAVEQLSLFRTKQASPVEFTKASLNALEDHRKLNFLRCPDLSGVLTAAMQSEARWLKGEPKGLLDGVLVSAKDNCLVNGWESHWGSRVKSVLASEDSPVVARLREAGATILGLTTMPEFGWKGVCDNSLEGATLNPWNTNFTSGGSSGGAAVAASLGIAALNIGTDGAGSIRIPAAFCGVVGFKPTYGLVPAYPVGSLPNFTHVGPITRNGMDAALMFEVISRPDARDWQALPFPIPKTKLSARPRAAYSRTLGYGVPDAEIIGATDAAVQKLRDLGWIIDETDPGFADPYEIIRPLYFGSFAHIIASVPHLLHKMIDPGLQAEIEAAGNISGDRIIDALVKRDALGRQMNEFHRKYDLLITPTVPIAGLEANRDTPHQSMRSWFDWNPFTYPFNLTQQPALSVPCGITKSGLPIGLQFVGPRYHDHSVLDACIAFESVNLMSTEKTAFDRGR